MPPPPNDPTGPPAAAERAAHRTAWGLLAVLGVWQLAATLAMQLE